MTVIPQLPLQLLEVRNKLLRSFLYSYARHSHTANSEKELFRLPGTYQVVFFPVTNTDVFESSFGQHPARILVFREEMVADLRYAPVNFIYCLTT
jgi:hypothetical protein